MNAQEIGKQIIGRAFELLDHYGLGPDTFAEIQAEVTQLTEILLDANASGDSKAAARRALKSIPLRIKQNAIAARSDIVDRVRMIGEALVRTLLGVSDLHFGGE